MFLIWGFSKRVQNTGIKAIDACTNCSHTDTMQMVKNGTSPTIFFIPIGSFGNKYFLRCAHCGACRPLENKERYLIEDEYKAGRLYDFTQNRIAEHQGHEVVMVSASQSSVNSVQNSNIEQNRELIEKIKKEIDYVVTNQRGAKMDKTNPRFAEFLSALTNSLTQRHNDKTSVQIAIDEYFK